jgi:cytochrome oxidase assembly protein ShyY1
VVRNRVSDNGDDGYEVVTPIRSAGGGPALLIDRGWIPKGHSPTGPDSVPAAQGGTVTITARLLPSEPSRPTGGLPAGQVLAISTTDVGHLLPYQPLAAFAVLTAESPTPHGAPTVRLGPVLDDGPHLSYAVQWVLFALVAVGGWWTFLRREAEEAAELTGAGRPALDDHADTDPAGNDRAEAAPAVDGRASPDPPTQQAITTG